MRSTVRTRILTVAVAAAVSCAGLGAVAAGAAPPDHAPAAAKTNGNAKTAGKGKEKTNNGNGNGKEKSTGNGKDKGSPGQGKGKKKPADPVAPTPDPPTGPGTSSWSVLADHPQASAQGTTRGRTLHDLEVTAQGHLVAGYGDYGANTGPIAINPFDPSTGTFAGTQVMVGTEEVNVLRPLDAGLYAPMIDPTTDATQPAGYATNATGAWTTEARVPAVHLYDVTERVPGELWMVGSANVPGTSTFGGATAYRSTDGGASWTVAHQETDSDPARRDGYERYYWAAAIGGKVYVRAHSVDGASTQVFDGTRWGTVNAAPCTSVTDANETAVFNGRLVCARPYLQTFDGSRVQTADYGHVMTNTVDFHEADGYLYGLTASGNVGRTADGVTWEHLLAGAPTGSSSIAVSDGVVYLGTTGGQILRADRTVAEILAAS